MFFVPITIIFFLTFETVATPGKLNVANANIANQRRIYFMDIILTKVTKVTIIYISVIIENTE